MNVINPALNFPNRKPVLFLILFFLSVSLHSFSQFQPTPVKRSNNQITISGKNFYLHEVLKGQTLYGISKEYQVSEEEIKKINPDLTRRAVFPGMVLRIPDTGPSEATVSGNEGDRYVSHTVLPKETIFGLSRQYGIKVDQIRELNPEARWGLKTGMIIRIPKDKITIAQKNPDEIEKPAEDSNLDSGPGLKNERADQPCTTKPFPHEDDNFQMAILLPLNISQNDTLSYTDTLKPEHFRFYEFLEGIYLAIDSMRMEGLNLTVEVFDTEKNPETIRGIIGSDKLKNADLIIGPVFSNEIEIVSAFARSNRIPMVSPFSTFDVIKDNPYAFQVRNNLPVQIERATAYLGSRYNQNIIVVGRAAEKSNPEFLRFTSTLGQQIKEHDPAKKATFKTIYYSETSRSFQNAEAKIINPDSYLSPSLPNLIILPSEYEVFITEVVNELQQKSSGRNIQVFGLNQWVFEDLDLSNLYNINLELFSDFDQYPFVDYTDPQVLTFCRKYRENWNIEPSKYSFQGFDVAYYFTMAIFQFGHNLTSMVPCWNEYLNHPSMLTPMNFKSVSNANGFENHAITIIQYQKDELLRKKIN